VVLGDTKALSKVMSDVASPKLFLSAFYFDAKQGEAKPIAFSMAIKDRYTVPETKSRLFG